MVVKKVCNKCGIEKSLDEFYNNKPSKGGLTSKCITCIKHYQEKNKDSIKITQKEYQEKNKDKINMYQKEYREKNKDKKKEWYEKNKDKISNRRKKNKDKTNKYQTERKNNNPEHRLKSNIRSLFLIILKRHQINKTDRFFKYTGISIDNYMCHFKKSPLWENFCNGDNIHIDHLIPCSAYDFNNANEIKNCWQPGNLRLLSANKNLSKNNKIDFNLIKQHNIEHLLPERLKNELEMD